MPTIKDSLSMQRGNVSLTNLQVLNAILYVAEQGRKWRGLPKRFGPGHTIYMRMNRWAKNGVLDRVFEKLQLEQSVRIKIEAFSIDLSEGSSGWYRGLNKNGPQAIGKSRGGWNTKIHMVAADASLRPASRPRSRCAARADLYRRAFRC
jgi:transposase